MNKVFIVHGFQGEPNGNWFPWLMGELFQKNIWACSLPMPNPEVPEKSEWIKFITESIDLPTEKIFLVGHSLGVPTILRYLETLDKDYKIGGVVLVSGPMFTIKKTGYEDVDKFLDIGFDFDHIKNTCKNFTVIHGDNDPNVPFSDAIELSNKLSCSLISVSNGGHLNSPSGYLKLPEVFDSLLEMIKASR